MGEKGLARTTFVLKRGEPLDQLAALARELRLERIEVGRGDLGKTRLGGLEGLGAQQGHMANITRAVLLLLGNRTVGCRLVQTSFRHHKENGAGVQACKLAPCHSLPPPPPLSFPFSLAAMLFTLTAALSLSLAAAADAAALPLWPYPASVSASSVSCPLSTLSCEVTAGNADIVAYGQAACDRMIKITQPWPQAAAAAGAHGGSMPRHAASAPEGCPADSVIRLHVTSNSTDVSSLPTTAEQSYTIDGLLVTAEHMLAVTSALETLSQLVTYDTSTAAYTLTATEVDDAPRFRWRGLLIDSARHFLPLEAIKRTLDGMAASKLNVLHWHLVDAQSFPYVVAAFPELTKGAWDPVATYSPSDVQEIVAYATARGINIMPEIDTPGHSAAWDDGYPSLRTNCPSYEANVNNMCLNPTSDETLKILSAVLSELTTAFPFQYAHVGGDEVVTACWEEDPDVVAWMKTKGYSSPLDVYAYFVNHTTSDVRASGTTNPVVWEEVFDNGLAGPTDDVLVEVWKDTATLKKVVDAGYTAVQAAGNYLDQQIPNAQATHYKWEDTWENFYNNDPTNGLDPSTAHLVLGGEAAMWGEQVWDGNIDSRVWPRAAATAERLWSPASYNSTDEATPRLSQHACRLRQRGMHSGPIAPGFCLMPSDVPAAARAASTTVRIAEK